MKVIQYSTANFDLLTKWLLTNIINSSTSLVMPSLVDIKTKFKKLAFIYHPDKGGDSAKFSLLREASVIKK